MKIKGFEAPQTIENTDEAIVIPVRKIRSQPKPKAQPKVEKPPEIKVIKPKKVRKPLERVASVPFEMPVQVKVPTTRKSPGRPRKSRLKLQE